MLQPASRSDKRLVSSLKKKAWSVTLTSIPPSNHLAAAFRLKGLVKERRSSRRQRAVCLHFLGFSSWDVRRLVPALLGGVLFLLNLGRLLGPAPSLLVPVPEALRQAGVLLEAPRSLHELLVGGLLLEGPRTQQLHHVGLVQDLLLQETVPHLADTSHDTMFSQPSGENAENMQELPTRGC